MQSISGSIPTVISFFCSKCPLRALLMSDGGGSLASCDGCRADCDSASCRLLVDSIGKGMYIVTPPDSQTHLVHVIELNNQLPAPLASSHSSDNSSHLQAKPSQLSLEGKTEYSSPTWKSLLLVLITS